jgi:acetolactate decarboxylase
MIAQHTPYQVSTATVLVEGIYQGVVRVGTVREHGDLGLGTFENLDDLSPGEQIEALRKGEIDLALIGQEGALLSSEFYIRKLTN